MPKWPKRVPRKADHLERVRAKVLVLALTGLLLTRRVNSVSDSIEGRAHEGDQCQYGHILGTDGKPLKIAPELLERYDRYSAARREGKKPETAVHAQMLMLNAIEQMDSRCFCLLDTGANALVLPRKDEMLGTEAQCTVPGGTVVPGTVVQTLHYGEDDYHVVAIEGASPLMPLSWLILLAGWSYMPVVKDEKMEVTIASPSGSSVTLVERSKMHCMDKTTFFNVLRNAWDRCRTSNGMSYDQLKRSLSVAESPHEAGAVKVERPSSITIPGHEHEQEGIYEEDCGAPEDHGDDDMAKSE